jgi:hypothetical protein
LRARVEADRRLGRADVLAGEKLADALDASVGPQERRFGRLREAGAARVEGGADDDAMRRARDLQRAARLCGESGLALRALAAVQHCVAGEVGVPALQRFGNAVERREWRRRRVDGCRRRDSRCRERRAIGCRQRERAAGRANRC